MNRRSFLSLAAFAPLVAPSVLTTEEKEKMHKFVITFPRDIKADEPIEVEAKDRLWAIASLGATVWTIEEWEQAKALLEK